MKKPPSLLSCSKVLLDRKTLNKKEFPGASHYRARYDFARGFRDLSIHSASDQTEESYLVFLKVGPDFSEIETLENHLEKRCGLTVRDEAFIAGLKPGEFKKLFGHSHYRAKRNRNDTNKDLDKYKDSRSLENLDDFVRHFRNVIVHGSVTASSIGLSAPKRGGG